jgi:hypothetical protein
MPSLPARIQAQLSHYYGIDEAAQVDDFIEPSSAPREALFIRERGGDVEMSLCLPNSAVQAGSRPSFDELCQIIEGVSHFVYVAERARRELPATQLELELQAEVDKYIVFAHGLSSGLLPEAASAPPASRRRFEPAHAEQIRQKLFERVTYLAPVGTEPGDRYRMANQLAARFAGWLESSFARPGQPRTP